MMLTEKSKQAFWRAIRDCLVEFHGLPAAKADERVSAIEKDYVRRGKHPTDIVYHEEPFTLACELVGNPLDYFAVKERYEKVLCHSGWSEETAPHA